MAYVDLNTIHNPDTGTVPPHTWGDQIRDNFVAGVPDVFTAIGDLVVASGANAGTVLPIGTAGEILTVATGGTTLEWAAGAAAVMATIYPVGIVIELTVSTNPNALFGIGTWAALGTGRVTVGIDPGDADFDVVEETGGAKTIAAGTSGSGGTGATGAGGTGNTGYDSVSAVDVCVTTPSYPVAQTPHTHPGPSHTHTGPSHTHSTPAHSIVQPYIVVYRWERLS